MKFKLVACEVLLRESCDAVARSPHQVDIEFLPKGLHDQGAKAMRKRLQEIIDSTPPESYEAILMGYGLCGTGLSGIEARAVPVVLPRAHDCIALLMGSRGAYQRYFEEHPGTYYRSTGWLERGSGMQQIAADQTGFGLELDKLIEKYGEENAHYLFEELTKYRSKYERLTYISTGLEPDSRFEDSAREEAGSRGWKFEHLRGDLAWFRRLVDGNWDEDEFVVVRPGERIAAVYDGMIMKVKKI